MVFAEESGHQRGTSVVRPVVSGLWDLRGRRMSRDEQTSSFRLHSSGDSSGPADGDVVPPRELELDWNHRV